MRSVEILLVPRLRFLALSFWLLAIAASGLVNASPAHSRPLVESQSLEDSPGKAIFDLHCAACHENRSSGAPATSVLRFSMSPKTAYDALATGRMRAQGLQLSDLERRQVSEYITGKPLGDLASRVPKSCPSRRNWFDVRQLPVGVGWGIDFENTRLIPAAQAGISPADLAHLKLKWVFAYPGLTRAVSQPLSAGGAVFVGSQDGTVYALDAQTGCMHWMFKAGAEIAGALVIDQDQVPTLFFGDRFATVYALDARSGAILWKARMDDHPAAEVVGTPVLAQHRLYVPVASIEEWSGPKNPRYACCSFRGSIVALDPKTGGLLWRRYTIPSAPVEQCRNAAGIPQLGPSGAAIWASLTVDERRGALFFGTGNNYSSPPDDNSDAIFSIDLATGETRWRTQTRTGEFWNTWDEACQKALGLSVSPKEGPDVDFSAPPVLVHGKDNHDILIAGRKDGVVLGLDPDTGAIRWTARMSQSPDPYAGELLFGMLADEDRIILPSQASRVPGPEVPTSSPEDGLYALNAFTGEQLWSAPVAKDCAQKRRCLGIAFAPIGLPGIAFAGSQDGYLRAYDSHTGRVLWRYNTARHFTTLSGERALGGSIERNGVMISNEMLFVNSGYGHLPGNVLLAFATERSTHNRPPQ